MQSNIVTVSNKWQVVIPKAVRKTLNIRPKDKVMVFTKGPRRIVVDLIGKQIEKARGFLNKYDKKGTLFKELLEEKRKDLEYEDRKWKRVRF